MTRLIQFSNNATSKLSANISPSDTSMTLLPGDGAKFPSLTGTKFFMATLVKADGMQEIVKVTARSSDTLTMTRAAEPVAGVQTSYAFTAGDRVELRMTAKALSDELDRLDSASAAAVQNKSGNFLIAAADIGDLFRVSTTGGNITATLPELSSLTDDYEVIVSKVTGDLNNVVITASGTDTVNGAATLVLTGQYQSAWMVADRTNGTWTAINSGSGGSVMKVDAFTGDGTANSLALSGSPGNKNNTTVIIDGVAQLKSSYSVSGTQLTPGGAIASGAKVEVWWAQPVAINVVDADNVSHGGTALTGSGGSSIVGFLQAGIGAVARTVQDKSREVVGIKDFGASSSKTNAQNKTALQAAITAVDAAGGGVIIVPWDTSYGYKTTDRTTYPEFTGTVNDITVIDYSKGNSYSSPAKDGAQVRYFMNTPQTTPVGQHDGNGNWLHGAWHPYYALNNTADYAAAGDVTRTANDNRRASIWWHNKGSQTWRVGQGTLAGTAYTDEELSNFVLEAYNTSIGNYAPLTIERKTGNWSVGGGTNAPQAALHVKNSSSGYAQGLFESLNTTCNLRLRTSVGSTDDVSVRNVPNTMSLYVDAQGEALIINKADRRVGIGVSSSTQAAYKLDVAESRSGNYVAQTRNTNTTNGSVQLWQSSSAAGAGWNFLQAYSDGGVDKKFQLSGAGNGTCDGTWAGGGADRAEMFEWADGNPDGFDGPKQEVGSNRAGCTVSLIGGKIKIAETGDTVIGVVSLTYDSLGNAAPLNWGKKYLRDDFGAPVFEACEIWEWDEQLMIDPGQPEIQAVWDGDELITPYQPFKVPEYETVKHSYHSDRIPEGVTVPVDKSVTQSRRQKLNPDFDPSAEYVPRDHRKEWDAVGVLGICRVRKGQMTSDGWVKMRDISDSIEEWFVR
ncbi:MAG TPA: peptidase G2 autoproteolytic cleavage domain-containing protein [Noviherbaspirillum sp.]|nr:peptidase G2 autoproteolytic cleavage domain-containing protein [Noviherbaspirillum sp.]